MLRCILKKKTNACRIMDKYKIKNDRDQNWILYKVDINFISNSINSQKYMDLIDTYYSHYTEKLDFSFLLSLYKITYFCAKVLN